MRILISNDDGYFAPGLAALAEGLRDLAEIVVVPLCVGLWWHAALGLVVGTILAAGAAFPSLSAIVPTLAATTVTVLASWFIADAANDDLMRVIGPSLVALLPVTPAMAADGQATLGA